METRTFLLIILLLLAHLTSCRTAKPQAPEVRTEVQVQTRYVERLVKDTVVLHVPAQSATNVTNADSSWLETDFAQSGAWIDTAGLLHHTLYNKAQQRPIEVQRKEVDAEHIKTEYKYIRERVEVAKPYPKKVTAIIQMFPWVLGLLLVCFCWIFRKPMINLIARIICR